MRRASGLCDVLIPRSALSLYEPNSSRRGMSRAGDTSLMRERGLSFARASGSCPLLSRTPRIGPVEGHKLRAGAGEAHPVRRPRERGGCAQAVRRQSGAQGERAAGAVPGDVEVAGVHVGLMRQGVGGGEDIIYLVVEQEPRGAQGLAGRVRSLAAQCACRHPAGPKRLRVAGFERSEGRRRRLRCFATPLHFFRACHPTAVRGAPPAVVCARTGCISRQHTACSTCQRLDLDGEPDAVGEPLPRLAEPGNPQPLVDVPSRAVRRGPGE